VELTRRAVGRTADRLAGYRGAALDGTRPRDSDAIVAGALDALLSVTRAPVAFVALTDESGELRVSARASDPALTLSRDAMQTLARTVMHGDPSGVTGPTFMGVPVRLGEDVLGMVGVANAASPSVVELEAMRFFADHIAAVIELARVRDSRKALVETLVNARAQLELSEERRSILEERARNAERLEQAHAVAVQALAAVSANVRAGEDLDDFYRLLTASVADLVGASKVLFWKLNPDRTLTAIRGAYGVDDEFIDRLYPAPCDPDGDDLTSQVVYKDLIFRAALTDEDQSERDRRVLELLRVHDAMSVPWRAGDERLGVVGAYDSDRPGGFSREDAWVLQIVGLAAGLVWQLKHSNAELNATVERLKKVDSARQLLLRNLSSAVDRVTRRFAGELHDDALQKLTAAELRLERAAGHEAAGGEALTEALDETRDLLGEVEEALRKLLFDVRPPALDAPDGLEQTVRDRAGLLRAHTGIGVEVSYSLDREPPFEIKSMMYRQLSEALTNIEKHSGASVVRITVQPEDAGVYVSITDNGRGFIVAERNHLPGHLGLLALNERALLAGGWCRISSEPGAGTIVEFWVPLPE
jgi:signal transduction histidine kinase